MKVTRMWAFYPYNSKRKMLDAHISILSVLVDHATHNACLTISYDFILFILIMLFRKFHFGFLILDFLAFSSCCVLLALLGFAQPVKKVVRGIKREDHTDYY